MTYLSKEIEARSKLNSQGKKSLVRKVSSCGIFQDYGTVDRYQFGNLGDTDKDLNL